MGHGEAGRNTGKYLRLDNMSQMQVITITQGKTGDVIPIAASEKKGLMENRAEKRG